MIRASGDCTGGLAVDTPRLLSIQVGLQQTLGVEHAENPLDQPWHSGIFKEAVEGPVRLGRINLIGDGQADTRHHGGPEQAILAYSANHYPLWREELEMTDLPFGSFGENFTITGLAEDTVCIGDTYALLSPGWREMLRHT
jgi:MOSC domain-containing protein YiiM